MTTRKKPWGGRFQEPTDRDVEAFTASIHFDRRLYRQDIAGSIAHARMLAARKIITRKEEKAIFSGLKAIEAGYRVQFTTAASLIEKLTKANAEGRLEEKLKLYTAPRLLIIDEIGYLPIDRTGANLFFQLISRRYERGPMILTSNQSFGAWGEVFGDRIIATAILDRLLHHAVTLNIRGNSYRLKDKLKAGLVRPQDDSSTNPGGEI